jgi:hypothetical protein
MLQEEGKKPSPYISIDLLPLHSSAAAISDKAVSVGKSHKSDSKVEVRNRAHFQPRASNLP